MDEIEKESFSALEEQGYSAYEMANVSKDDTGLPYDFWIDSLGDKRKSHGPRIKVRVDGKDIPVTISDNPDIPDSVRKKGIEDFPHLAEIKKYIKAYKEVLLAHYRHKITDKQTLILLSTIKNSDLSKIQIVKLLNDKK